MGNNNYKKLFLGQRFTNLTVVGEEFRKGTKLAVKCVCDCGKEVIRLRSSLLNNETISCGCVYRATKGYKRKNPRRKYSLEKTNHKLYSIWKDFKRRGGISSDFVNYNNFYDWAIKFYEENNSKVFSRKNELLEHSFDNTIYISSNVINKIKYEKNKDKIKKTCIEKYGFESPLLSNGIQEKVVNTNIEKYGTKYIVQTDFFKEKSKNTKLEKYGTENCSGLDFVKEKRKKTCLRKYSVDHYSKTNNYKFIIRASLKKNNTHKTYNGKFITELAEDININPSSMYERIIKYGPEIAMSMEKKESGLETFLEDNILKPNNLTYEKQFRISNRIADFKIDNVIVECDGLYWHSEAQKEKDYHKNKRENYISNGFKPLFFTEDEILQQKDKVESIILNKLNKSNRIFARKCEIKELGKIDADNFFNNNHLMNKGRGKSFGLYYNNELVTAIRVCKVDNGIDISRFCHKLKTNVIGGFSKLIKHIEKTLNPSFIQTFIDLRYGSGDYLNNLGFEKKTEYLSFSWIKNSLKVHRMNFPSNSGYNSGFVKLWDCGQAKYIKANNEI